MPTSPPRSLIRDLAPPDRIDGRSMPLVDVGLLLAEDGRPKDRPVPLRVARPLPLALDLTQVGTVETLPGGGTSRRLRIDSAGALFLSFKFSEFELPPGAELHFVSVDHDYWDGPYDVRHNRPARRFGSPMVPGDSAVIELYLPAGVLDVDLVLESVSHGYRDVMGMGTFPRRDGAPAEPAQASDSLGGPFACQRDINCPEGAPYQVDKRAVAEGYDGTFICSGTMINNVKGDCRYLYLTAEHCGWWQDPAGMAYYWNYENSGCGTNDAPLIFSTGSTDLYHNAVADIDLLELDGTDLETIHDIYFSGWSRSPVPPTEGATISFPSDKPKQIVIEFDPITDCSASSCPRGFGPNFWRVEDWDVGTTQVGSSGGGLLDQDHRLVGVLTGGIGTNCNNFQWEEYAKIHPQWADLQPFLDPDATGAVTLDGRDNDACLCTDCTPPPLADGRNGFAMTLDKGAGDTIVVHYDNTTCGSERAVMLQGDIGDWSDYQGAVGLDCNLGNSGSGSFTFSGDDVWFNLIWVNADGAAGLPGYSSETPRTWSAAGHCAVSSDDTSDPLCD